MVIIVASSKNQTIFLKKFAKLALQNFVIPVKKMEKFV